MPKVMNVTKTLAVAFYTEKKEKEIGQVVRPGKTASLSEDDLERLYDDYSFLEGHVVAMGDDGEIINRNNNALTDSEIKELVSNGGVLKKIKKITSPVTLQRIAFKVDSIDLKEKIQDRVREIGKQPK